MLRLALPKSRVLQELLIVGLGYGVYSQIRGLAADRVVDAFDNGTRVVRFEQDLGIFKELALQALVLPHDALVYAFNIIYFYGLFPLLLPTAAFLFVKRPQVYTLARNAFLASGGIAAFFFLLIPTAPPRLMGLGIIDTLNKGLAPSYESIPGVNHFAAMPSMHVGWNLLVAVALYMALDGVRGRALILLLPPIMFMSTVVTGNHYFVDGMFGLVVAIVGLGIALLLQRWGEKRELRRDQALLLSAEQPQAPSAE